MRSRMNSAVLVATVVVLSATMLMGLPSESFAYTPHSRIVIDSNADFTLENGVTGGSGLFSDPYLIEGWEIYTSWMTGIKVGNTTAHFVIRDSYVYDDNLGTGIHLENVTNGLIQNVTISNVSVAILVDSSRNITIEGNVLGGNAWGIFAKASSQISLSDNEVWSSSSGVVLEAVRDITAVTNSIYSNNWAGIQARTSDNLSLVQNMIFGNRIFGVDLRAVTNFTAYSNNFTDDGITLSGHTLKHFNSHTITEDNIVNGKSIIYRKDIINLTLDDVDAGQILVSNSSDVLIANNALSYTDAGIQIAFSSDVNIESNQVSESTQGITILYSDDTVVWTNSVSGNLLNGIHVQNSTRSEVLENEILQIDSDGISFEASSLNTIHLNSIREASGCGICIRDESPNSTITSNTLSWNSGYGILVALLSENTTISSNSIRGSNFGIEVASPDIGIEGNNVSGNIYAMELADVADVTVESNLISNNNAGLRVGLGSSNVTIIRNNMTGNGNWGLRMYWGDNNTALENDIFGNGIGIEVEYSWNNLIYHNNIRNNTVQALDYSVNGNSWHNGYPSGGNHWSNYSGVDNCSGPNQDVCPDPDGIGDSPFVIDIDGEDTYPLMMPYEYLVPSRPSLIGAILSGNAGQNVTLAWSLSADDGSGPAPIVEYEIYRNTTYESTGLAYGLIASVPNGTTTYTDSLHGEGDPSNYFYRICAVNVYSRTACAPSQAAKFTRPLALGPNLVSVPLIQSDESIETVLQTVKYDKAWSYNASSKEWNTYAEYKPYKGSLGQIGHAMGVWVNVTQISNLTLAGIVPAQTTIHLRTGWNLVSFPSFSIAFSVMNLKAEVGATRVEGLDPAAPPNFLRVLGDAQVLQAGRAYWMKVDFDVGWTVEVS